MGVSPAEVNERLAALTQAGTSVWLDQIRRNLVTEGELQRMVEVDSLRGVTSNPSIFEKAILGSPDYDDELAELAEQGKTGEEMYRDIAVHDLQLAADVLRPVWEEHDHADGFVSMEVGPTLAHDTEGTLGEARMYWERLDRPNAFIKIPGTPEGVPAIEQAIYEGINVNITLLFAVSAYEAVAEAYIRGLERRREEGKSVDIRSVASFFVSRVDTEVDRRLDAAGRTDLAGTAGIANARAAYRRFGDIFGGERFAALREAGARVQRPLWASTGVKNPHYSETMYVDELVAPETVNTMPMPTLLAVAERGEPKPGSAEIDPRPQLDALAEAGIDLDDVTEKLLSEGVDLFEVAMEKLMAGIESRREAVVTGRPMAIDAQLPRDFEPALAERVKKATEEDVARRVWKKDETLWGGPEVPEIGNRLGWLTISEPMQEHAEELMAFAQECYSEGLRDAVLLGMGGSSLGPEVIRLSYGRIPDSLNLQVLDSTDPDVVLEVEGKIDPGKTLFIVSSKSGLTVETVSHFKHFHPGVVEAVGEDAAGSRFVAITDPGSPLQELAEAHNFRRVFRNAPDIGGRYSVLSYFGLVPAALMGVNVSALIDRSAVAEQACANYDSTRNNSGLWLGLTIGELAQQGRDKCTFIVSEPISSFGLWVEQLIAESTGKHGKGILPVAGEPVGAPEAYGEDRVFVYLRNAEEPDEEMDERVGALAGAGHPTLTVQVHGAADLGRIFFFSEFATAVAGWALGINPFDQPNVQEAKDNTNEVLEGYAKEGRLPEVREADDDALRALLGQAKPPRYVAIMGYVPPSKQFDRAADELRRTIRDATTATTTFGYGPRFLHSTGQFHKGGPPTGLFLQLVHNAEDDVDIPGAGYTFGTLKNAQATGDLQTLHAHGLPAERVRLEGDPVEAVEQLTERIRGLL